MTVATMSGIWYVNTIANFRATGFTWSSMLDAIGLMRTSDAGQIDWTTVPRPTVSRESAGYEIRILDDSLSATHPLFVRFDYTITNTATSGTAVGNFFVLATFGKGSDGDGGIIDQIGPTISVVPDANGFTYLTYQTEYPWYGSSGDGYVAMATCIPSGMTTSTQFANVFLLERFRNPDGSPNGEGFMVANVNHNANVSRCTMFGTNELVNGSVEPPINYPPFNLPVGSDGSTYADSRKSQKYGDAVFAVPYHPWSPRLQGGSIAALAAWQMDFPPLDPVVIEHYGQPMAYRPLGPSIGMSIYTFGATRDANSGMILMRWEE